MQKVEHKLSTWYNLYSNEKIIDVSFEYFIRDIDNLFPNNEFYKRPKATIQGIEFDSLNQYGFSNLNLYTLLNVVDIFEEINKVNGFFRKKAKILFSLDDDKLYPSVLKNSLIRYFKNQKHYVYGFDVQKINQFIFQAAVDTLEFDFSIFISYNAANKKYYLQIYKGRELLNLQQQEALIDALFVNKKHFMLHTALDVIVLNVNKIIDSKIKHVVSRYLNSDNKLDYYSNLSVYLMVEDNNFEYILERFFSQVNIKYSKLNPLLNKDLLSTSSVIFWRWLRTANYKADLIIIFDKNQNLKLVVKTKEGYVNLNNDEIAYLFINSQYLYWKQNKLLEENKLFIPLNAASFVIQTLENYKINYKYEDQIQSASNVLFAYNLGFSNSIDCKLNYDSIEFLINFCFMLWNYKENNNLFTFKYKKMNDITKFLYLHTYQIKKDVKNTAQIFEYIQNNPSAFGKYKVAKLKAINYENDQVIYFFKLELKAKHHYSEMYFTYNKLNDQNEIKIETKTDLYKLNQLIEKIYIYHIQRKIIKKYLRLANKLNKAKDK
ncbi:MAG5620 family putative phospho-sugar mutase [Mycoplasma seminis]|uniref:Uncharacterized protein n=1 Tax=Mycoplasma seminis TaxID=512749 RepID=A0ABY9H9U3_9MOLU|nr:hypothetical protein [Mycoplasma seminis]WLP85357.1 hypothetical protein Q8852_03485 [Mycoplasma seminis]